MSGGGARLLLAAADRVAADVVGHLEPYCERIQVAGSVRRRSPTCGDVEVVCIPRYGPAAVDLFGMPVDDPPDLLHAECERLEAHKLLQKRLNADGHPAWGRRLKLATWWGTPSAVVPLDVYTCTPEQWGVTLAIRTGPADFSRRLVTDRQAGGFCPSHLYFRGWRVVPRPGQSRAATPMEVLAGAGLGEPLDTPEEADVFEALGLDFVAPEDRT